MPESATSESAPSHLLAFLAEHMVQAAFIDPGVPMPTVTAAAEAIGVHESAILKTLLFVGNDGQYVVAIASGTRRIDKARLSEATGIERPRPAQPEAVLAITGYPAGGVAPLGLATGIPVVVDQTVAELSEAFGGGGVDHLLLRLDPADIVRLNNAKVANIIEDF